MDDCLSGEEQVIKARKPYTITKQRERWTDEEHNRFLEALKLYGRAWQRIEEHIGTKTAVQIRSHAQKFFSKLEKEALVKGVAVGQAIDIEIPPPRPKRKPNTPYPRKTGATSPNTQLRVIDGKQVPTGSSPTTNLDLEEQHLSERTAGSDGKPSAEENCGYETCSETLTLFKDTPSNLAAASTDENSATTAETTIKSHNLKVPVPMEKQLVNNDRYVSPDPDGTNRNHKDGNPDTVMTAQNEPGNEMHAAKTFLRHAPVQILDGSIGASSQAPSSDVSFQESSFHHMGIPGHPGLYSYPQNSTSRSNDHQPSFHPPFTMLPNIQEYSPYMQHISLTFSNLIISTLLQNPAAHAAASFAASYWPSATVDSSSNCPGGTNNGVFSHSIAAIAAATVAAATAWWAAHGLLPSCSPHHVGFSCPNPFANDVQTQANGEKRVENNEKHTDLEIPKSSETSSSDCGNIPEAKKELVIGADSDNKDVVPAMTEQKELSLTKTKKQVDRSSCGSNTPSGSDAETVALQKNNEGNEEPNEPDSCQPANETGNRRNRVAGCINDNWKAVSEGGRLAFQALFSRERLPQSFSPPHEDTDIDKQPKDGVDENMQNAVKNNEEDESKLDLNCNTWESCFNDQVFRKIGSREEDNNAEDGLHTICLKTRKTGFKPYKRCSVEARESTMNSSSQEPEQRCKRLRVEREGEA
uniref:Late elongated hypocotyl-like protein n=1 Tax=Mirabilis jalapa TaxID=3538 RepID=B8YIB5_MIRJA|nr:late elongated hypocotyl-like protein [Mirabilis jalapa]